MALGVAIREPVILLQRLRDSERRYRTDGS